jgi:hypothetical protein
MGARFSWGPSSIAHRAGLPLDYLPTLLILSDLFIEVTSASQSGLGTVLFSLFLKNIYFFFCWYWVSTQGLAPAKQVLYHLRFFTLDIFQIQFVAWAGLGP